MATLLLLSLPVPAAAQSAPTTVEIRRFLQTAEVVAAEPVGIGITDPWRLTLDDGTLRHDAHFQPVDMRRPSWRVGDRIERPFIDSYRYNLAAYRLAELLGLGAMMPVTVEREWDGRTGSLSWWLDDVMFDEHGRIEREVYPPDMVEWARQMSRMQLFAELVQDTDRNQGNVVYTAGWRLWMLDFSRAFRRGRELLKPADLSICHRALLERLDVLTAETVEAATTPYLHEPEIAALMTRRDALLAHFHALIARRGEESVLFD